MKNYEISVLLIEPDEPKKIKIEEILDYVGLSGRNIRDTVTNEHVALNYLKNRTYDLILGNLSGINFIQEQIQIEIPEFLDATGYISLLSSLTVQLEKKFGFNYDGN